MNIFFTNGNFNFSLNSTGNAGHFSCSTNPILYRGLNFWIINLFRKRESFCFWRIEVNTLRLLKCYQKIRSLDTNILKINIGIKRGWLEMSSYIFSSLLKLKIGSRDKWDLNHSQTVTYFYKEIRNFRKIQNKIIFFNV